VHERIRARLDKLFGADNGHADLVPARQKVVQAAGRILRTPQDQGAYFSPSWTLFQADRGRHFSVIVDGVSG
jgi:hypothetical protein